MAMYAVDVYSGSSDSIIRDPHVQGVIVKATQGTGYVNPACNHQYALAKSLGKKLGLYHYAAGGNPEAEANYFINNIKNYVGTAVLALDWEKAENHSWGDYNWSLRFVKEVHRLTGVWCMIYCQASSLAQVGSCASVSPLWVADYLTMNWHSWVLPNMNVPTGAFPFITIWQFTGDDMDRDICYLDEAAWDKIANPSGVHTGWSQSNGRWSYVSPESGKNVTKWQKINNHWYYFGNDGYALTGWQQINGKWYYFDPTNVWALTGWNQINKHWYYMDPNNAWCVNGWNQINNHWYYMDDKNAWCLTGWQTIKSKVYYFDPTNCWMLTGKQIIDGKNYTFDDNGALVEDKKPAEKPAEKNVDKPKEDKKPAEKPTPAHTLSDADRKQIQQDLVAIQNASKDILAKVN